MNIYKSGNFEDKLEPIVSSVFYSMYGTKLAQTLLGHKYDKFSLEPIFCIIWLHHLTVFFNQ